MQEVRVHGRFGQPVGKLVAALSRHASQKGKHVQIFNCFAAYRPGGPMYTVLRSADETVRQRSANNTSPDVVVVLDNSLFASQDVTKGLKPGGTVIALGVGPEILGDKATKFAFLSLDSFLADRSMPSIEAGLIKSLEQCQAL